MLERPSTESLLNTLNVLIEEAKENRRLCIMTLSPSATTDHDALFNL